MFEKPAAAVHNRLSPANTSTRRFVNHNHHATSTRAMSRTFRHNTDARNAAELLRDGHLRVALAGFNNRGFTISPFICSTDHRLAEQAANLPTQVKMVPHHNVAAGLQVALQMLSRSPAGRTGIVILASDETKTSPALAHQLVQTAIKWKTAIHVIQITDDSAGPGMLGSLSTRSTLGYGGFRKATPDEELTEIFRNELDGLAPARGMVGVNSVLFLADCSERMVESFGGSTRIEIVASALQEYLHNPFTRRNEKRLALAAQDIPAYA